MAQRTITVQRFDPAIDREARWQVYRVELADHQTILDALLLIAETIDPTVAFRRTCRSGICGACAATVNGRARLLCQASIGEIVEAEGDIRVAPLPGFRVLRDLVVDMEPFFNELERVGAWLVPAPDYNGVMGKDASERLWSATRCVLCGICAATDGNTDAPKASHPAAVARVLRFANDPRDLLGFSRLEMLHHSVPTRSFAERLKALCPKQVDVTDLIPETPESGI